VSAEVRAKVPASGEHVQVLRNVVAALAARAGCTVDVLSDLRLAVDEAATRLLHDVAGATDLVLEASRRDGRIELTVAASGVAEGWPPEGLVHSMGWQILSALVDDAHAGTSPDGPTIAFTVRAGG
jgi:serine/threonine-protein kinase RsbW